MDYKSTLNLPKTEFPMKANLSQREPQLLAQWDRDGLYERLQRQDQNRPRYILHDGPPYANGRIHIGHALNKILKDFVIKSKAMEGFSTPYVPGWDCHGLPIEHQVMKDLGPKKQGMSQTEIRRLCRDYADKFIQIQREEFKRLGVLGDWEHPYLTMNPAYEAAIVREFGKVVAAGSVYRAKKPVLWCPNDETALAEAEVEYEDHTSPSIYVKFPIVAAVRKGPKMSELITDKHFILIWTTTPWTLPANQAVAVHPTENYLRIEVNWEQKKEIWILAEKLYKTCMEKFGLGQSDYHIIGTPIKGNQIQALTDLNTYHHPFFPTSIKEILTADFVTMDQGTGCVHIAPGHGQEDYELSVKHPTFKLKVIAPVDNQGRFTDEVGVEGLSGKNVFKANPDIIHLLKEKGALVHDETLSHTYPHCWRCKKPVIFRATEQWFISMETKELRRRALKAIDDDVKWIPKWGRDRIYGMIENRPDWCISRQRAWGVPIVAFACLDCKELFFTPEVIYYVADRIERDGGSDIWFTKSADELLPKGTSCPKCSGGRLAKENDILDVWFESGVSHAAVLKTRPELQWPADLYLEGSDQHRGWFHSALLTALLTDGRPPYKAVLTHGFVVDGAGKKMSKSAGNVVAPQEVIEKHGAEILRLWIAATDFREDVRISQEILSHLIEAYRKIRNTSRFLLGNLYDYDPKRDAVPDERLFEIDRWALHRLQGLIRRVRQGYTQFEFHTVFHALNNFCAVDLSAIYLDILKDRLYSDPSGSASRRAAQRVLFETLTVLTRLMAPILSFTAEEIWNQIPRGLRNEDSVHLGSFPEEAKTVWMDKSLAEHWENLLTVRDEVARALEKERKEKRIGSSLEASVRLYAKGSSWNVAADNFNGYPFYKLLEEKKGFLPSLFIVSQVDLFPWENKPEGIPDSTIDGIAVQVLPARGTKCGRCWCYREDVGRKPTHPELCARCAEAVG